MMASKMRPEDIVKPYDVSRESLDRLARYAELLLHWQKRINLIGPSTVDELWTRHIGDALEVLRYIPEEAKTIVDLGSGAGLPGLVIAIAGAGRYDVHLVESNSKKAAFLREAARVCHAPARVHNVRIEYLDPAAEGFNPDVVTARALAPLPKLLELAEPMLKKGAIGLFHKGQDVDTELTDATKYWNIDVRKHSIETDSAGCILEIRELERVAGF
jgi:16S rRNA (guanine527-N7)-methyltransferase